MMLMQRKSGVVIRKRDIPVSYRRGTVPTAKVRTYQEVYGRHSTGSASSIADGVAASLKVCRRKEGSFRRPVPGEWVATNGGRIFQGRIYGVVCGIGAVERAMQPNSELHLKLDRKESRQVGPNNLFSYRRKGLYTCSQVSERPLLKYCNKYEDTFHLPLGHLSYTRDVDRVVK